MSETAHPWGLTGPPALAVMEADFLDLPHEAASDAALGAATRAGASHADIRVSRQRSRGVTVRDARAESVTSATETGMGVRVLVDGVWGFAAGPGCDPDAAAALARRACELARVSTPLAGVRVELADEPVHVGAWASPMGSDPFQVGDAEVIALLAARSQAISSHPVVTQVDGSFEASRDLTHYADTRGTRTFNQRTRVHAGLTAWHIGEDTFEDLSTTAPPSARGWEYVAGDGAGWDWAAQCAGLPELLAQKVAAPSIEPGRYDLVIDPTNLWLTIHESIGHATELDRALGYEANYAGTSFATPDQLGTLRYGSALMNVTGDRLAPHGLASTGYDDEGVAAQQWDIVHDGILVGYQLDRRMAAEHGFGRSNGCAFADSAGHVPIQRMPNVSLRPDPIGPSREDLIAGVDDGILVVGDKSWSIDMARYNFQFTGQLFHRIRGGRIVGQCRDVAYQSRTPDFWASLVAVGNPSTYLLGGALNCGKGQPGQVAAVSHGAPLCRFNKVNVLNTAREAGR